MNLKKIHEAISPIVPKFYHGFVGEEDYPYGYWQEDSSGDTVRADNVTTHQAISGLIHYFTLREFDPAAQLIERALDYAGISWFLSDIQQGEADERVTHYTWRFCVEGY